MRTINAGSRGIVVRTMVAGVAVSGLIAGCGTTVGGSPKTEEANATGANTTLINGEKSVVYNPCKDLSDEKIRAAGADPATKRTVTDAQSGPAAFRICQWEATDLPYYVSIGSSIYSLADTRNNDKLTDFRDVPIGPRTGLVHKDKRFDDRCYVSLPMSGGSIMVTAGWKHGEQTARDICDLVIEDGKALEPFLPK
ncbi:DUF3558 domain-containing protein [Nocardia sp. NPDC051832]|uniref:DUF3558 domain-containing protein n=1 Tax=Nocardia sp. NPDC051832 TaxID=3155673 RepID=UPI00343068E8